LEDSPDPYSGILEPLLNYTNSFAADALIGIFVILGLLLLSALISGSEVAFFSLSQTQIERLKKSKLNSQKLVVDLLEKPKQLLATILIANNIINIAIIILSTFVFQILFNFSGNPLLGFIIQVILVTLIILLFAEILPKVYAAQKPLKFAAFMANPLRILEKILNPLSWLLVNSTRAIDRRLEATQHDISMDELSHALEITSDEDTTEEDKNILRGIVRFGDIVAREIMRSRVDVVAVDIKTPFRELFKIIKQSGYSRMPVYIDNFDNVSGILYIKDLLPHLSKNEDFNWQKLVRNCFFVPESKKINDLLKEFQEKKIHMAVVVDEYGGTSGIVTLEDILEEIVGEINDEFDIEETVFSKIDNQTYVFEGKTLLKDFCRITGVDYGVFNEVKGEADTLAGLILELKKELPFKGEIIKFHDFQFEIEGVDNRRIKRIKVMIRTKSNTRAQA
jgi:putative hemolysin